MLLRRPAPIATRPLAPADLPLPEPGPGEIRVRVSVCAVCRTDLHVIEGDLPARKLPLVPGHQAVGEVDAVGRDCARFRRGERVGIAWLRQTCGDCPRCRSGSENLCDSSRYTGYHEDGGYAEHALVPEAFAYAIPDRFDDREAAPLLCSGIIGYRALCRCRLPDRGRLGLFGFGSSAHVVLQIALHRGHEVFVATRGVSHRELARGMGAHWVGAPDDTLPAKLDGAIVFAPAGEVVPIALRALDRGGTVSLAGITLTPLPAMDYEPHLFHEKTLTSVEANTRADGEELLREAARIPLRPRVTEFGLEQANEALLALREDRIDGTAVLAVRP